ncbi:MAG: hypothetical protein M1540_01395 [Candidatus Bathyarchaeota archaeon]|nr:hypothetical protein [Candidatus Bathyarchaeota archaeon]
MSYLPNRAPQVTRQYLWDWTRPDVLPPVPTYDYYPQNPNDKDIFKHTGLTPNQYFQYKDGTGWEPVSPTGSFQVPLVPTGQSPLQFHDTEHQASPPEQHNGSEASLFLVYINEGDPQVDGPLLMTDRGLIVKKDLMAGGFLNSGQGTLWLNYGLVGKPKLASPPAIQLMSSATPYPSGTQFPDISPDWYEEGQLFNLTSSYYWSRKSKTYPAGKYRWEGNGQNGDWVKGDSYTGNYDTLYLCKDNLITPAHLDLGNLTSHGNISITPSVGVNAVFTLNATAQNYIRFTDGTVTDYIGMPHSSNQLVNGSTQGDLTIRAANKKILFTTNDGASIGASLDTSGNLNIAGQLNLPAKSWGNFYYGNQSITINRNSGVNDSEFIHFRNGLVCDMLVGRRQNSDSLSIAPWYGSGDPLDIFTLDRLGDLTLTGWLNCTAIGTSSNITCNGTYIVINPPSGTTTVLDQRINNVDKCAFGFNGTDSFVVAYTGNLKLEAPNGSVKTANNTLDDSSGNILLGTTSYLGFQAGSYGPNYGISFYNQTYGNMVFWLHEWGSQPWFSWRSARTATEWMHLDSSGNLTLAGSITANGNINVVNATLYTNGIGVYNSSAITSYNSINPYSSNSYGLGGGSNYWSGVCSNRLYAKDGTVHSFDALDDLGLVKNYKVKTDAVGRETIDLASSLPHVLADDDDKSAEFYDVSKMNGFTLGCLKALALNKDKQEAEIQKLKQRIETLEKQLMQKQTAA